ncbi:hypothetical protein GLOIN_2v1500939 [Rhizophagus irregularis DAOM 181602=DAOM 197198]|uniref:Uncharacterized protein n=3 Tax=Rhizophagus irregularis (strain DAOM 181602 / DAOM 197198 / MUCL 43194) TaxID=747089 RepID=A0A2P4PDX2_RHIID|nr:hypothetical protein GLOIN_2v1684920 [Rhizophagus irregularis DAOM 181602=DAOM 197198]XP_025189154.1 hypothetical protein GLOIN_2v1500939 [Rhizophagus irregularis DAOM 181602=DAOM 197198]POG63589.1 hypothetical protein GLOIN_2v1684920 [Rhizophagus irregularis DAOM 181602=DAOM 197198]POG82288.1 hypothetical protein GLOIN_2v1500939 [Rhizophagus irregularis DAOM 181602=DAOM 197198]GBC26153.2 hypothetical protein GLOIN_2v1500939 [Rhizophagus irregularis DAOM 181602=DAOM 197198]GET64638.1 hypoth|eukprot:XP_025170455.1 hypothetical protein GLOIN_2v1684920 [Rhizophagus irregularis DAOM 181602=DAOM 197198]
MGLNFTKKVIPVIPIIINSPILFSLSIFFGKFIEGFLLLSIYILIKHFANIVDQLYLIKNKEWPSKFFFRAK